MRDEEFSEGGPNFTLICVRKQWLCIQYVPDIFQERRKFFQGGKALLLFTGLVTR